MPHTSLDCESRFDEKFPPEYFKTNIGYFSQRNGFKQVDELKSFIKQEIERAREEEREIIIRAISNLPPNSRTISNILESLTPPESK